MACDSVTQLDDPCYLYLGICVAHPSTQLKEIWHSTYAANFWLQLTCTSQMQPGLLCPPFTRAARLSFKTAGFLTYKRPEMDQLVKEASWLEVRGVRWILIIQSKNESAQKLFNSIWIPVNNSIQLSVLVHSIFCASIQRVWYSFHSKTCFSIQQNANKILEENHKIHSKKIIFLLENQMSDTFYLR